jgi:hypothetical protein
MQIPSYYHHPSDRSRPPETECFTLAGKSYCKFRAGNISISYPRSLDVLMEDGRVIAEGDCIIGPIALDRGVVVLVQSGPFTHLLYEGKSISRERVGLHDIKNIAISDSTVSYTVGSRFFKAGI